ncbi:MAG: hypothetical protein ACK502_04110 [Alphaproteobacteria bacterium]
MMYAISGMESPLSFVLLGWFLLELFKAADIYRLLFITALLALTRLDNIILIAPVMCWVLLGRYKTINMVRALFAISPFLLWSGFSLVYYGFIFPNTKYAKLSSGISSSDLIENGINYFLVSAAYDIPSALMVVGVLCYATWLACKKVRPNITILLLCLGCIVNGVYVVYVGGDYMFGRFTANTIIVCIFMIPFIYHNSGLRMRAVLLAVFLITYFMHAVVIDNSDFNDVEYRFRLSNSFTHGHAVSGLFTQPGHIIRDKTTHKWAKDGQRLAKKKKRDVVVKRVIGATGFYASARHIIIDSRALSDVLLARLPVSNTVPLRSGHYTRDIPKGYIYARKTGNTSKMEKSLEAYYQKIRLITSAELFRIERLREILLFNIGRYDYLIERYNNAVGNNTI